MLGAALCIPSKPDHAGGALPTSISTWKPVYAGGSIVCEWEALTQREVRGSNWKETWRSVHARSHIVYTFESRQCGRHTTTIYI